MRRFLLFVVLAVVIWQLWLWISPQSHPPGITSPFDPKQTEFATPLPKISKDGWTLEPLALFSVEARVLSKLYYKGDSSSSISPVDLALGWGPMSNTAILERLDISQSNRFFHWRYWGQAPLPEREIIRHATNAHIIPANDGVLEALGRVKKGSLVKLHGYLVEATHPALVRPWRSSLTRDDSGAGACEIIYLKSIVIR